MLVKYAHILIHTKTDFNKFKTILKCGVSSFNIKKTPSLRMAIEAETSRSQLIKTVVIHILFISFVNILLIKLEYTVKSALQNFGVHV
jgi:hypothetical protein